LIIIFDRSPYRGDGYAGSRRDAYGEEERNRQEAANCGNLGMRQRHLQRQNWSVKYNHQIERVVVLEAKFIILSSSVLRKAR
jgi:hypothetical protein